MRLGEALAADRRAGQPAVVPYLMVDRRRARRFAPTVAAFRAAGATALELGFPFSDPVADGPVLEAEADRSLRDGTRWKDLLAACRVASRTLPVAVMTYANPVWRHGLDRALGALAGSGATGLIVPDLSLEDSPAWRRAARRAGISLVLLAAPGASSARVAHLARASRGFLYLVAHYGTTGATVAGARVDLRPLIAAARAAAPRLPLVVGFGIRDRTTVAQALGQGADGVVVATALEERIARGASPASLGEWLRSITRPA